MVALKIRPGVLNTLRESSGIKADDAFARSLNVTHDTIARAASGAAVSAGFVAAVAHVYGLPLNEVAYVDTRQPQKAAA